MMTVGQANSTIEATLTWLNDIHRENPSAVRRNATSTETVNKMRDAISALRSKREPLPPKLTKSIALAQQFGWIDHHRPI